MRVDEIMKDDVLTLEKGATVKDTIELMIENDASSILILDSEKLVGVVTERDVLSKVVVKKRKLETCVGCIMTKNIITISPEVEIERAAEIMAENKISTLPVTAKKKLIGIITLTDIVSSGISLEKKVLEKLARWFPVQKQSKVGG